MMLFHAAEKIAKEGLRAYAATNAAAEHTTDALTSFLRNFFDGYTWNLFQFNLIDIKEVELAFQNAKLAYQVFRPGEFEGYRDFTDRIRRFTIISGITEHFDQYVCWIESEIRALEYNKKLQIIGFFNDKPAAAWDKEDHTSDKYPLYYSGEDVYTVFHFPACIERDKFYIKIRKN